MRLTTLAPVLMLMLAPTAVLTSASCVCTLIGYRNGLNVEVGIPATAAAYRIEVEAEGDTLSLQYQVTPGQAPQCVGECQVEGARIELSAGFPLDGQHLGALVAERGGIRGPATATVRVFRDEALAAEDSFTPHYQTDEPNGAGCGEHTFATASLDVP